MFHGIKSRSSAIGVTNQRETTLVWDKETGEPLYNAIGKVLGLCMLFFHPVLPCCELTEVFSLSVARPADSVDSRTSY